MNAPQSSVPLRPFLSAAMPPARPSLLSRYNAWVRTHATALTALEGAASTATWLLPERFGGDGELGAEAVHSALGLASVYHEAVLGGAVDGGGEGASPPVWPLWLAALQQVRERERDGAKALPATRPRPALIFSIHFSFRSRSSSRSPHAGRPPEGPWPTPGGPWSPWKP